MIASFNVGFTSGILAVCLALILGGVAQAAPWTFRPELRRLDTDGNELPAGSVDVARRGYTVTLSVARPDGRDIFEAEDALLSGGAVVGDDWIKTQGRPSE